MTRPTRKASTTKAPATKAPARKATTTKAPAKKAPAKKAPARKAPAPTVADRAIALIRDEKRARPRGWNRDALVRFFAGEGEGLTFPALPAYRADGLSAEARARGLATGWNVPADCFTKAVDQSGVNSVRAYIRDVVLVALRDAGATNVPAIDDVATTLERDGMVIYRRA